VLLAGRVALAALCLAACGLFGGELHAGRALHRGCPDRDPASLRSQQAQTTQARISVVSLAPARIRIEAELPAVTNVLSFRNIYGGVLGLGERIEMLEATSATGEAVRVQKLGPGEFQSTEKFARCKYEVNLAEPLRPAQMSHVSWLNREHGLLMLMDLLPTATKDAGGFSAAEIEFDLPTGWTVAANAKTEGPRPKNEAARFSTDDPENAVFMLGPFVHEKTETFGAGSFSIITSGKWPFSEKDAIKIARQIIGEYSRVTRFDLKRNAVLMLVPYPGEAGPANWTAETRGNDVVLLLGRNASGKRVVSRLGIVLSHELFHLWVPNSLKLAGDYDWFFEGFTLYHALRMDLRLGLISFDGYLETIASVYDSYLAAADRDRLSLIEASERRWTTSSSLVYEKGMLTAVVYDLSLRRLSDCRESLDDVYADLFRLSGGGQRSANETIIGILSGREGLASFAKDYIEGAGKIDLDSAFSAYGIQVQTGSSGTKLIVNRDPSSGQRKLLGCIGYRR
jgi:predicted metalloprotease with PDZ domain